MSGKLGANPQDKIIDSQSGNMPLAVILMKAENLVIEGSWSAIALWIGWMEPLRFANTKNITLNGITIIYKRRPKHQGEVTALGAKNYVRCILQTMEIGCKHNQIDIAYYGVRQRKIPLPVQGSIMRKMEFWAPILCLLWKEH